MGDINKRIKELFSGSKEIKRNNETYRADSKEWADFRREEKSYAEETVPKDYTHVAKGERTEKSSSFSNKGKNSDKGRNDYSYYGTNSYGYFRDSYRDSYDVSQANVDIIVFFDSLQDKEIKKYIKYIFTKNLFNDYCMFISANQVFKSIPLFEFKSSIIESKSKELYSFLTSHCKEDYPYSLSDILKFVKNIIEGEIIIPDTITKLEAQKEKEKFLARYSTNDEVGKEVSKSDIAKPNTFSYSQKGVSPSLKKDEKKDDDNKTATSGVKSEKVSSIETKKESLSSKDSVKDSTKDSIKKAEAKKVDTFFDKNKKSSYKESKHTSWFRPSFRPSKKVCEAKIKNIWIIGKNEYNFDNCTPDKFLSIKQMLDALGKDKNISFFSIDGKNVEFLTALGIKNVEILNEKFQ